MRSISFGLVLWLSLGAVAQGKPNIVFILADDLGWSDTTLYGKTRYYQTPNLERLAARGVTFDRAYAASPLCSPTRASILTGQTPARTGITSPGCHSGKVVLKASAGKKADARQYSDGPDSCSYRDYFARLSRTRSEASTRHQSQEWRRTQGPRLPVSLATRYGLAHAR